MPEWYQDHRLSTSERDFVSTKYLSQQLIAYIGNKRRMLGQLYALFRSLTEERELKKFVDPFAGSGSVARLARQMGMDVWANDWEEYARVINRAYLCIAPKDLLGIFSPWGGIEQLLGRLNNDQSPPRRPYISRYYAPRETVGADYRRERLFFTAENALFIDRTRGRIEELFPRRGDPESPDSLAGDLITALLLYEAATHVNTSGVFKAFHKGFGGHGGDALGRIMAPMSLEYPVLCSAPGTSVVEKMDAADFLKGVSADLCYLDPPYTIHQYGSNYHLLNTIAKWDFPPVDNSIGPDGSLERKAGIREDWVETRSRFCSRRSASGAFERLLEAADARYIVLSYNSEGLVPLEELMELLTAHGRVSLRRLDYTTYRGGRQSLSRRTHNTEFQLVIERQADWGKATGLSSEDMNTFFFAQKIKNLLRGAFVPKAIERLFPVRSDSYPIYSVHLDESRELKMEYLHLPVAEPEMEEFLGMDIGKLQELADKLEEAACADRLQELRIVTTLLQGARNRGESERFQRRILKLLKKITHKKYRRQWSREMERLQNLTDAGGSSISDLGILRRGLADIRELAERRFSG